MTTEGELDTRWVAACRRASVMGSVVVLLVGVAVLLGWIFDVPLLKSVHPSFVTMKVNTASLFVLFGAGLLLLHVDAPPRLRNGLGLIVVIIAAATLSEYVFGIHLGIDELFTRDSSPGPYPGRMSPVSAVSFIIFGCALLLPDRGRPLRLSQMGTLLAAAGALVAICGYIYSVGSLYAIGPYSATGVHTATGELIGSAAFLLARPEDGLMRRVSSNTIAGQALRRLLPVIVLAPIVIGWLGLEGQFRGYYQTPFGTALMVLANVLLLTTFVWGITASLERSERSLRGALKEIGELNTTLERRVDERTREVTVANERLDGVISLAADAIISVDEHERIAMFNRAAEEIFGWQEAEVVGRPLDLLMPERFRSIHHHQVAGFAVEATGGRRMAQRGRVFGLRKNGEEFPAEAAISKLRLDAGLTFTIILRDITERVRKEDERKILVALLENSSDFIGIADPTGKPVYLNPAGRRMVGLPSDVAIERTQIPDYYPTDQRAFATDVILKSMLEHGRWSGETYFRHWQTNASIPVSDEHFMIRDPDTNRLLGMGTVTRDISAARRASDQLRESEERFRLIIDEAPIGMALVDLDGRFVRVNRALCDIVGYSAEELTRLTFHDITHADDLAADVALAERLGRGEIPRYQLEKRYLRKDGSIVQILLHGAALRGHDGAPLYYIAQIEDITERKRAEEALRLSQESLALAVDASGQGLWDWNIVTDEANLSPRYWSLIGRVAGTGRADFAFFKSLIHPDDLPSVEQTMQAHLDGQTPRADIEYRVRRDTGEYVWLRGIGRVMERDAAGAPLRMAGVISDITEQKRAEQERARALREKETLLKEIHHRVKNNLQMLSSLFYLQRERTDQESLRTLLDESRNRIQSIALIHEKLYQSEQLASIDFGEYLRELTSRLTSAVGALASRATIRIHAGEVFLDIDRAIPCALIVNELVSNSLKHAFPDGRRGQIDITVDWAAPGLLRLAVSDSGVGFPEDLDFKNTRTLGMQLVCSLTTQLRGTVSLSRDGGTTFEIRFAVAAQPGAARNAERAGDERAVDGSR